MDLPTFAKDSLTNERQYSPLSIQVRYMDPYSRALTTNDQDDEGGLGFVGQAN